MPWSETSDRHGTSKRISLPVILAFGSAGWSRGTQGVGCYVDRVWGNVRHLSWIGLAVVVSAAIRSASIFTRLRLAAADLQPALPGPQSCTADVGTRTRSRSS